MTKRPPATIEASSETAGEGSDGRSHDRPVAAGGRLRLVLGFLIGVLIGALLALILPRDDGPRRVARPRPSTEPLFPADPLGPGPPDGSASPRQ